MSVEISVCIVNWNTCGLLRDCLNSIFAQSWRSSLQVIVVDNASKDRSVDMVHSEFPQVELIVNNDNVGFARANNRAFERAQGRYVLLLNSDTVVLPGSFDAMAEFLDRHPEAGAVGCKLLNRDGSLQRSCWRGFPSLRMAVIDAFYLWKLAPNLRWVKECEIPESELTNTLEVDHLIGACMLVRREVIEHIGGMDGSIFLFLEETEWCYRMRKNGWGIYFYPSAQIIHIGQQSANQNPERNLPEKYRNFVWFYRKCQSPSKLQQASLKAVIATAGLIRMGLWTWRGREVSRRDLARRMRAGYWQVVRQAPQL